MLLQCHRLFGGHGLEMEPKSRNINPDEPADLNGDIGSLSAAERMDGPCGNVFAGARFTIYDDVRVGFGRLEHQLINAPHAFALPDKAAQPEHILRLGFSITRADGHALTDASQVAAGTTLTTTLLHGTLTSTTLNP